MLYKPEIAEHPYSLHKQRMSGGKFRVTEAKKLMNWFCNTTWERRGILSEVTTIYDDKWSS